MKNSKLWIILRYLKYNTFNILFKKVYVLNLDELRDYTLDKDEAIKFKFSSLNDIKKLNRDEHEYEDDDHVFSEDRLYKGDKVVIGYLKNHPVFYGWQMSGEIELSYKKHLNTRPDIIYSYKVFVVSSQRGKSVLGKYYNFISSCYVKNGIQSILVAIDNKNIPSIRAHKKCGFTAMGYIITIKIASYTINLHNLNFE